jgi:hypothetical protein
MRRFYVLAVALAATASAVDAASAEPPAKRIQIPPSPLARPLPKRVPVPEATQPATATAGEVPADLIAKMRADLSKQAGVDASAAKVVSAESVVWPSGALGCAQPGEMYTQATVPGYRVQFEVDGRPYAYHASTRGFFKLCPNPSMQPVWRDNTNQ